MKSWRIEKHGGPEVLQVQEVPTPEPGPGEARVQVLAVGLNHLDLWVRKGVPGHRFPLPLTPGCDSIGIVESLGAGVNAQSGPQVGDTVIIAPGVSCGRCEACASGFEPLCPQYGILGESRDGGLADFLVVPYVNLIPLPKSLSVAEAAALPIPYLTAWTMLVRKAQVRPGDLVLIQAGGSGVSVAATQLCKLFGATVITTVRSRDKAKKSQDVGADHVIVYGEESFRDSLKKILSGYGKRGVQVAIDHVGAATFSDSLKSLAWGGTLVTCGATSGAEVTIDLKQIFFKNISVMGATMGSRGDLIRIVDLAAQGKIRPVVDSVYAWDRLPEAMARLENRSVFGKIVVER